MKNLVNLLIVAMGIALFSSCGNSSVAEEKPLDLLFCDHSGVNDPIESAQIVAKAAEWGIRLDSIYLSELNGEDFGYLIYKSPYVVITKYGELDLSKTGIRGVVTYDLVRDGDGSPLGIFPHGVMDIDDFHWDFHWECSSDLVSTDGMVDSVEMRPVIDVVPLLEKCQEGLPAGGTWTYEKVSCDSFILVQNGDTITHDDYNNEWIE